MYSAFGVEDDRISKADDDAPETPKGRQSSPGRTAATVAFAPVHGAVAGRKGKKLRAAGSELGGGILGGLAGTAVDVATKGKTGGLGSSVGGLTGVVLGGRHNEKKGYLKPLKD